MPTLNAVATTDALTSLQSPVFELTWARTVVVVGAELVAELHDVVKTARPETATTHR
jgi:hypothetical protein